MLDLPCPGLPAGWINGWLAAVGVTVLEPRIRLHWTEEDTPIAVLSSHAVDPAALLAESWPNENFLAMLPIARDWTTADNTHSAGILERKVSLEQFVVRAQAARTHPEVWSLSSTMTDLSVGVEGQVAHAPFDPVGPGSTKWLHHRLMKVHKAIEPVCPSRLKASLFGRANRVKNFGLGFDITRIGSPADDSNQWVEPVIEFLAFFGLKLFPMRARGVNRQLEPYAKPDDRQRGWRMDPKGDKNARSFFWPAWRQPLDADGIDALLDAWKPGWQGDWGLLGIHAGWKSLRYQRRGTSEAIRAFGSQRL